MEFKKKEMNKDKKEISQKEKKILLTIENKLVFANGELGGGMGEISEGD